MRSNTIVLSRERNVTLTAYIQEADGEFGFSKRPAMLVLPGGGYAMCSDRERIMVSFVCAPADAKVQQEIKYLPTMGL